MAVDEGSLCVSGLFPAERTSPGIGIKIQKPNTEYRQ